MKHNEKHLKYILLILIGLIIIFAAFLRLNQLGKIPVSMSDDETRLTYSAYSIWKTGRDLNGIVLPLNFSMSGYSFNPIPIYVSSPFVGLLGLSMFSARLPFALAGIVMVFFVYLITHLLTKNKPIALLSAGVLTFSVWAIQLSRFAYEGGMALLWYTIGVYLFLNMKKIQGKLFVLSLLFFIMGFYSYSGYKITFVPIILLLLWYKRKSISKKYVLMTLAVMCLTFASFFYLSKTQGASHYGSSVYFFGDMHAVETSVELERRASGAPEILKKLYHNKVTYITKIFLNHYLYAFSPQYLVTDQEASGIFSLWFRGQLYYHEILLLFAGMFFIFLKWRRECLLVTALLLIAALPSGLGPDPITYTIRSSFMLPWLSFFIGAGIYGLVTAFKKKQQYITVGVMGIIYCYTIGGYMTQYYYEWTTYGANYYSKADSDLAYRIIQEKDKRAKMYVGGTEGMSILHYAFYSRMDPANVQKIFGQETATIGSLTFSSKCFDLATAHPASLVPKGSLVIMSAHCIDGQKSKKIIMPTSVITSLEQQPEWYTYEL